MNVLVNVPIWVYFVIMAITFMFTHVVAYKPDKVVTRSNGLTTLMRIGSSVLLLIGLLLMQPAEPVTLLLALALSAVGGYLSGTAAPPPRVRQAHEGEPGGEGSSEEDGEEDSEASSELRGASGSEPAAGAAAHDDEARS